MTRDLAKAGFAEEALPQMEAVHRFALRLTGGNDDEAGDLVQETYLRAYRAWEGFSRGTNVRAWLFTICRNVFLRSREKRGHAVEVSVDAEPEAEAMAAAEGVWTAMTADPERAFFDSFVDEDVLRQIDRLPQPYREAVVLVDQEDFSYAEASEMLNLPVGTVKSRLYRGRRLLQEALYDYAREMGYVRPETRA